MAWHLYHLKLASRCWVFKRHNFDGPIFQCKVMRCQCLPRGPGSRAIQTLAKPLDPNHQCWFLPACARPGPAGPRQHSERNAVRSSRSSLGGTRGRESGHPGAQALGDSCHCASPSERPREPPGLCSPAAFACEASWSRALPPTLVVRTQGSDSVGGVGLRQALGCWGTDLPRQ